ncbi:hypothetical protein LOTGIDRAFT_173017 [Lottia gigantea]|uniref:Uncharacterized protein n=1 Tax=Lottia gigantea TaxID=225164 RepID=V4B0W9_LOTGI|nr:hypothetical protein LOTGIDRAFT_173017 [Lottia gigantea]ESP00916.1 hypothetical protein LOTGIDRAFT_173017 [Lottia gigantea]
MSSLLIFHCAGTLVWGGNSNEFTPCHSSTGSNLLNNISLNIIGDHHGMIRTWLSFTLYCVLFVIVTSSRQKRISDWLKSSLPVVDDGAWYKESNFNHQLVSQILRDILAERNLESDAIDEVIGQFRHKLDDSRVPQKKSSWKYSSIPIQTRFAAFGQKLVPGRTGSGGDHGPTMLRYGRSARH